MRKVNDRKIFKNKWYPWYYTDDLEINLVPISYISKELAIHTLTSQFGKKELKTRLNIIKGSEAISRGMVLGKNTYWVDGKRYQVKKLATPPIYSINKSRRRLYAKKMKKLLNGQRSGNINFDKTSILNTYADRF